MYKLIICLLLGLSSLRLWAQIQPSTLSQVEADSIFFELVAKEFLSEQIKEANYPRFVQRYIITVLEDTSVVKIEKRRMEIIKLNNFPTLPKGFLRKCSHLKDRERNEEQDHFYKTECEPKIPFRSVHIGLPYYDKDEECWRVPVWEDIFGGEVGYYVYVLYNNRQKPRIKIKYEGTIWE